MFYYEHRKESRLIKRSGKQEGGLSNLAENLKVFFFTQTFFKATFE